MTIHVTPIPKLTSFATPDLTLTTANAAGSAGVSTSIRSDASILVYDATVPTTIAYGASAAAGDTATAARRNHTHGMAASDAVAQASQAEMEGETDVSKYVPPDLVRFSPGVAKAYCEITNAAGAPATGSYNVTSGAKNATGDYTITWDDDFSATTYTALAGIIAGNSRMATTNNLATGTCDVNTFVSDAVDSKTVSNAMLIALGDQ